MGRIWIVARGNRVLAANAPVDTVDGQLTSAGVDQHPARARLGLASVLWDEPARDAPCRLLAQEPPSRWYTVRLFAMCSSSGKLLGSILAASVAVTRNRSMAWMRPPEVSFEREPLYEEVWSQPITKLAASYGLSDNGLRKVCAAMDIPVPPRGYWAKLAAGQPVQRTPLPMAARRTSFIARPPPREAERPHRSENDEYWLAARLAREAEQDLRIVVDPAPTRWHPQLRELRAKLQADQIKYEGELREYQREQVRRAKGRRPASSPDFSAFSWSWRVRSGGLLLDTHRAFPLRVTAGTWHAAMALVNAIFFAAEKRGVTPTLDEKKGRFCLSLEAADLTFAVREPLDTDMVRELDWYGKPHMEKVAKGNGRLFIAVYKNGYDYRKFMADESGDFGDLSEILFAPLYRNVVQERERRRAQAERARLEETERQRQLAIQAQRAAEEERQRELARLAAIERHREAALLAEARTWEAVGGLRRYLAARSAPSVQDTSQEWLAWARAVAERLDPIASPRTSADGSEYDPPQTAQAKSDT